jgi:hypothetical protein
MTRIATTKQVRKLARFATVAPAAKPCADRERPERRRIGALPADAWRIWFERQTF